MTKDIENKNYIETRSSQQDPVDFFIVSKYKIANALIFFAFVLEDFK